ncbi:hypothetical protein MKW98_010303 [Papaver atlanticum]|uniref:Uncharacterized protein n=1 Tax=Papaver atlanticum TaxID=357466 RepID=A0AAD4XGW2_9MAGN|nr:hypothetical protein MKW98_010303 [Papaver atlanticum]
METIIEVMKKKKRRTKLDDKHVVCLIGFYLCCVPFFGDKNASSVNVKYLALIETYETVLEVSWPDLVHEHLFEEILKNADCPSNVKGCVQYILILFAEHTPAGLIQKVQNNEQKIPRVGRWDMQVISDFIAGANMTEFTVSVYYYLLYILFTITCKRACVADIYTCKISVIFCIWHV